MSDSYTKLFSSITESTIWSEPAGTRLVWITMLAKCNRKGEFYSSVPGLARLANVTMDECKTALETLMAPDEWSRTPDHDGRRIEPIDGGWRLLNHAKFDKMRSEIEADERRAEYKRKWDREHRGNRPNSANRGDSTPDKPPTNPRQPPTTPDTTPTVSDTPPTPTPTPTPTRAKDESPNGDLSPPEAATSRRAGKRMPACPQKEIIALYLETLPELPAVNSWPETAARQLKTRWRESVRRQSLDWWREFFGYVRQSDFLMGRKTDFTASLQWLVKPTNFAKVVNGNYANKTGRMQ